MNENDRELDLLAAKLRRAMPPCRAYELKTDLWPRVLHRLQPSPWRFGLPEALIAGLLLLFLAGFPELIPIVLYHF